MKDLIIKEQTEYSQILKEQRDEAHKDIEKAYKRKSLFGIGIPRELELLIVGAGLAVTIDRLVH